MMLPSILRDPEAELPLPTSKTPLYTFWIPEWEIRTFPCLAITPYTRNIKSLKILFPRFIWEGYIGKPWLLSG